MWYNKKASYFFKSNIKEKRDIFERMYEKNEYESRKDRKYK